MRVLLAEDNTPSREVLRLNLDAWGYESVACADGAEAWAMLQRVDTPRLAVLDWMMPEISGLDLCRQVRALDHGRQMYLILLTARGQREDIIMGLEAGADDYLVKPFDRQELKARIQVGERVVGLQQQVLENEQMRVLAETAGAAAHEINQPLTIALGKLDLLMMRLGEGDAILDELQKVHAAVERISGIVQKMSASKQYVTRTYIPGVNIVDFDASSKRE